MGVISPSNNNFFKSAALMYSSVKRLLRSYNAAKLIDEGEFPTYIKEVLRLLKIGVYKEKDAVIKVKGYKAILPADFSVLYAAYKCSPYFDQTDMTHLQGQPVSVYNDVTWELIQTNKDCQIECCENEKILEKITVRQYVKEKALPTAFVNPVLLRLSPNVRRDKCAEDCQNILASSPLEITLDNGCIITNFNDDCIYLKYYAFPVDDNGVPEIPDIEEVEQAIKWYIVWQEMLRWQLNSEVPDLANRPDIAQREFNKYFAAARWEGKLHSFIDAVNIARRQRSTNLLIFMSQQG